MKLRVAIGMVCSLEAACLGEPYAIGRAPAPAAPPLSAPRPPESAVQIAAQDYDTCLRTVGRGTLCTGLATGGDGSLRPALRRELPDPVQRLSQHNGIGFVLADVVGAERPAMLRPSASLESLGRLLASQTGRFPDFGGVQGVAEMRGDAFAWTGAGELFCAGPCRLLGPTQRTDDGALATLPAIREVALGSEHACALLESGRVECWGDNRHAQCGTASLVLAHPRTPVAWIPLAAAVAAGTDFTCIVKLDGEVLCWGGEGPDVSQGVLPRAAGALRGVRALSFGALHGCALRVDGAVDCWGMGPAAGSAGPTESLARVAIPPARALASGLTHTCAATDEGEVWCWGANAHGEVGAPPGEVHGVLHPVALVRVRR